MAYFNELPNLQYVSRFANQSSNEDVTLIKNIFKRAKLREDIANVATAFDYYQIRGNERADQIAERVYGDSELDWVILITNNITNVQDQWPLDDVSFRKHLLEKYGSEGNLYARKHYETIESRDEYNRVVVPGGLVVDDDISQEFKTTEGKTTYGLTSFPNTTQPLTVSINLNQKIQVTSRDNKISDVIIDDINIANSVIYVRGKDGIGKRSVVFANTLNDWPKSWGGSLSIKQRDGNQVKIDVDDLIGTNDINIDTRLYEIVGEESPTGGITPAFRFK